MPPDPATPFPGDLLADLPIDAGIVVLTGAGISRESGLHTFRDADGIWATVRIEDVATPEAFARDPDRVHGFYNARRRAIEDPTIQPNAAHHALARLEREWRGSFLLVTQNVDPLHGRAGSRALIPMHGELARIRCSGCGAVMDHRGDLARTDTCPSCRSVGTLRPHIVWFGEIPFELPRIERALAACDLFVAIGTSGHVYPAAGFVAMARAAGARTLELNLEPTAGSRVFDHAIHGPATVLVPAWVDALLTLRV